MSDSQGAAGNPRPRRWLAACLAAGAYVLTGLAYAVQRVGLQYDEALFQAGATTLYGTDGSTVGRADPAHLFVLGRPVRVMAMPYAGDVRAWLLAPVFRVFGHGPLVGRVFALAMTVAGLIGIGVLVGRLTTPRVAAVTILLLGVNPALVDQTVFDNSAVAAWVLAVGLLCLAIARLLRRPTVVSAGLVGAAAGFGMWTRLNFAWQLVPLALAALPLVFRMQRRVRMTIAATAGLAIGAAPLLMYEFRSGGPTGNLTGVSRVSPLSEARHRLVMAAESLVADGEHRALWGGGPTPRWTWTIVVIAVIAAIVSVWWRHDRAPAVAMARVVAVGCVGLFVFFFTSPHVVAQHHSVTLVLPATLIAVLAAWLWRERHKLVRIASTALGGGFVVVACALNAQAVDGLARTHGVGVWSDAHDCAITFISQHFPGERVLALDWGFSLNAYVLTGGQLQMADAYWTPTANGVGTSTWAQLLDRYPVAVTHTDAELALPDATRFAMAAGAVDGRIVYEFEDGTGTPVVSVFVKDAPASGVTTRAGCLPDSIRRVEQVQR